MQANYQAFVERMIFRYEGGYGWHPSDPGGPTKYGITCFDLAEHLGEKMTSMSAWAPRVKAMTLATADDIYRAKYARQCRFDDLPAGSDCAVFDFGVNSGSSRAIKFSQMIVGTKPDGFFGPITLAAINKEDPVVFVSALCAKRLSFLRSLGTWGTFGGGWSARVHDLEVYSTALAKKVEVAADEPEAKQTRILLAYAKGHDDALAA